MHRFLNRLRDALTLVCGYWFVSAALSQPVELRVGLYENEPKIFTAADGSPNGIFPDLLRSMADAEGWTLRFVPCEWNDCLHRLEQGQLDLMPDVALTDERLKRFGFHEVPALHSWSQLYRRPEIPVASLRDLEGRRIAVLRGSVQQSALAALLDGFGVRAEWVPVDSFTQAFDLTAQGAADVAAVNYQFGNYAAESRGLSATPVMFDPAKLYFAVPEGRHAEVLSAIDRRLLAWQADGGSPYFRVLRRWGDESRDPVMPAWVARVMVGLTLGGLMLGGLALWMRRRVRQAVAGLQAANVNLESTLRALPDLMFEIDGERRFRAIHASRPELLLYPESALLGRRLDEVMPPDALGPAMAAVEQALHEGSSQGQVIALPLADGTHWFELSAARKPGGRGGDAVLVLSRDITDRRRAEERILQLSALYAALGQGNEAIIHAADAHQMMAGVCEAAVAVGGLTLAWAGDIDVERQIIRPRAWYGVGGDVLRDLEVSVAHDTPDVGPTMLAVTQDRPYWCQDYQSDPYLARWRPVALASGWRSLASIPLHRGGRVTGALVLYSGVTHAFDEPIKALLLRMARGLEFGLDKLARDEERRLLLERLHQSELRYRQLAESINDVIWTLDPESLRFTYVSPSVRQLRGYTPEEVMAQPMDAALQPADAAWIRERIHRRVEDFRAGRVTSEDYVVQELQQPCKDGSQVWTEVVTNLARDPVTGAILMQGVTRNISERKAAQARIEQLAHFDQLTGLPNRSQLRRLLEQNLAGAQRHAQSLAVIFVDLDHFKTINDSLGHEVGDVLLVQVAQRLQAVCRTSDITSRMGGDEFIVVLPDTHAEGATQFAQRLLEAMRQPFHIGGNEISAGLSLGIALFPDDGADLDTLLRNADAAMYQAKAAGRNDFRFFTPELQARSDRLLAVSSALARALERDQLQVHYQPLVSLRTGEIVGAEALLRWHHPELGHVSPAEFIPVVESTGRILELGRWVLEQAAQQGRGWTAQGRPLQVAVNISAVQFRHRDFVATIENALSQSGIDPRQLELELTESIPMGDPAAAAVILDRLARLSVSVSIDDFGTGHSSLGYLKKLGFYKLKIDRSFVADIGRDPDDEAIITAIVELAKALGMQTLAEGVETLEQARFLAAAGCDCLQGWLVSPAVPADAFAALLSAHDAAKLLKDISGTP